MTRREQVQTIKRAVNPRYIRSVLMDLSAIHREDASDGFNAAAAKVVDLFGKAGLETASYTFSKDDEFNKVTPAHDWKFWQAKEGWLEVVGETGRKLADVRADPICVHRMSVSCDYRNKPVEVVMMDRGYEEENYADVDFEGKIIFIKEQVGPSLNTRLYTNWAVGKRGAVGHILSAVATVPGVRGHWNQYDTIAWNRAYPGAFSFGITPREGDRLANLYYEKKAKGEKLYVYCYIDADKSGNDELTNAEGIIRGETDEEILLYAHLCHPRPSANDNLSGCSAVLGGMYALNELISRGVLPRPKRTIRGVLGAEMTGTSAEIYRPDHDRKKLRATFNMDMVGAQQGPVGVGPLCLSDTPRTTPNICNDVASFCMEEVGKDTTNAGSGWVSFHNMTQTVFSPGSDHDIWNDPELEAPCARLGQWPDTQYHSSSDDITSVDPSLIAKSAAIAVSYAYIMATLDVSDLPLFMAKGCENMTRTIVRDGFDGDEAEFGKRMHHIRDFYLGCCDHYTTFFTGEEKDAVASLVKEQKERVRTMAGLLVDSMVGHHIDLDAYPYDGRELPEKYQFVAKKHFFGKIFELSSLAHRAENGKELVAEYEAKGYSVNRCDFLTLYYCNGERTFAECITRAMIDQNVKNKDYIINAIYELFMLLHKLGSVTIS